MLRMELSFRKYVTHSNLTQDPYSNPFEEPQHELVVSHKMGGPCYRPEIALGPLRMTCCLGTGVVQGW